MTVSYGTGDKGKATGAELMADRHYEVVSEEMVSSGYGYEPPEDGCAWAMVLAPNAKRARVLACQLPEFEQWVKEARADGKPPFKGLTVRRFTCEHGNCMGCGDCHECIAEAEARVGIADG